MNDKELNKDPEATPGFFEKNGRVKTVKLRGEYSTGYITPLSSVEEFIGQEIEKKEDKAEMPMGAPGMGGMGGMM